MPKRVYKYNEKGELKQIEGPPEDEKIIARKGEKLEAPDVVIPVRHRSAG